MNSCCFKRNIYWFVFVLSLTIFMNCFAGIGDVVQERIIKDVRSDTYVVYCGQTQCTGVFAPPDDLNVFIPNGCPVPIHNAFTSLGGQRYKFSISRNFFVDGLTSSPHNSYGDGQNRVFWHFKWGWEYRLEMENNEPVLKAYTIIIDGVNRSFSTPCSSHDI